MEKQYFEDPEINAFGLVNLALKDLDDETRIRVIKYTIEKLKIGTPSPRVLLNELPTQTLNDSGTNSEDEEVEEEEEQDEPNELLDGIGVVARKWMQRNGISADNLSDYFSIGMDEIDLVAKSIPGEGKKERAHNVILLKGIATYLGNGETLVSDEAIRQTCIHYDAFDAKNHAKYLKSFTSIISGNKSTGYSLTPKGMTEATALIKKNIK